MIQGKNSGKDTVAKFSTRISQWTFPLLSAMYELKDFCIYFISSIQTTEQIGKIIFVMKIRKLLLEIYPSK